MDTIRMTDLIPEEISTGFRSLDEKIIGWKNSDLIVIGSRPSVGKSTFALNVALNAAVRQNVPVAFFSLEMRSENLLRRILIREAEPNENAIKKGGKESKVEWTRIEKAVLALKDSPLFIVSASLTVDSFKDKARKLVAEKGVKLVIIDYLQLMSGPQEYPGRLNDEMDYIVRALKETARELDIPIIVLSQLSRVFWSRTGAVSKPQVCDLREPVSIEEHADLILLIDRPTEKEIESQPSTSRNAEIIIGKNRDGVLGTVPMRFIKEYLKFD